MSLPTNSVRFGPFQLDLRAAELHNNGTKTRLPEQPFQILVELVEHPGEVVTREELRQRLWRSDTFVDFEHSLNAAVKRLRAALDDSAENPRYIETLPCHGYRLMVPVEKSEPVAPAIPGAPIRKVLIPVAVLLVAAAIAGSYFRSHPTTPRLTDKDAIVLSDFDNKTGDSVFDDTLKQGLSVQLEQSPFLALISDRRVNETLKLMGRPPGDRLTANVTLDVCQRTGSKAMLTGSIAGLGSQYVIGLKAVNCNTGDVLAEAQERAASKEANVHHAGPAVPAMWHAVAIHEVWQEAYVGIEQFSGRVVPRASYDSKRSLGRFRLCVLANAAYNSLDAGALSRFKRQVGCGEEDRTWLPRRQPRSRGLALGGPSANPVFVTLIVNFQVIGNPFAGFVITQNGHVFGMIEVEELHA